VNVIACAIGSTGPNRDGRVGAVATDVLVSTAAGIVVEPTVNVGVVAAVALAEIGGLFRAMTPLPATTAVIATAKTNAFEP
jgi:hypothetical protein